MGTPTLLMPLIVVIELISCLIRPLTLAVRLVANIIAGHLLLRLVGRGITSLSRFLPVILTQTRLIILEIAVAFLQGYVFMVLLTLYSEDV